MQVRYFGVGSLIWKRVALDKKSTIPMPFERLGLQLALWKRTIMRQQSMDIFGYGMRSAHKLTWSVRSCATRSRDQARKG